MLQQIRATMQDKGAILAERDQANARALQAETSLATAQQELAMLRAENQTLKTERAEIEKALAGEQAQNKDVERQVATTVATTMGVDPKALPKQEQDGGSTLDALNAKLEAATDPKEIFRINAQINAELAKQNGGSN